MCCGGNANIVISLDHIEYLNNKALLMTNIKITKQECIEGADNENHFMFKDCTKTCDSSECNSDLSVVDYFDRGQQEQHQI